MRDMDTVPPILVLVCNSWRGKGGELQVDFCLDFFFSFQGQGQSGCEAWAVDLLIVRESTIRPYQMGLLLSLLVPLSSTALPPPRR
ncbi:hypothetical protein I7I53_04333 [Histoplasma capsulatum var. duboisii H88]|uniref:Uncharacterized protein n=1 Tax=Ajellomyces capsulatus (strain H88) TaxID=544711 RepID=A0A8A1LQA0_AJEC8|nr:hypothetical protein I7I53_04333 [Histoplasma capsulatum var. duboisii H88]